MEVSALSSAHLRRGISMLVGLTATLAAQAPPSSPLPTLPLPPLPAVLDVTPPAPTGLRVDLVDAATGAVVADATVRWLEPKPKAADGSFTLPRGAHWFEVTSPTHVTRREHYDTKAGFSGTLRVPLLPRLVFVRGQVQPPLPCEVTAPADLAAGPPFPASAPTDAEGRFVLALREPGDSVVLTASFLSRSQTITIPTVSRASMNAAPHQALTVVTATLALTLTEREQAAADRRTLCLQTKVTFGRKAKPWVASVDAGLAWLVAHQDEDGRWDADGFMKHDREGPPGNGAGHPMVDVGVTALALMALLGDGHTPMVGLYAPNVRRAAEWLLSQRIQDDIVYPPDLDGVSGDFIYGHCLATLALCEAFAAGGDEGWRLTLQRIVDYLEKHRNPYGVWSYMPRGGDNRVSSTLWGTLALCAARRGGFTVNKMALEFADSYVDEMTDPNGRTGYDRRGGLSGRIDEAHAKRYSVELNEAMTGAGLLIKTALGHSPTTTPSMTASLQVLAKKPPRWDPKASSLDFYAWSIGTQAMWLVGDKSWDPWAKALSTALLTTQRTDGNFRGSWDPIDAWGERGGRVYATAILVLALQSPWRLPKSK